MEAGIEVAGAADIENIEIRIHKVNITRQRNFFAGLLMLTVIANFLLVAKISITSEKLIMVPGITKELVVDGSAVSQSYLEETAMLFASALLDLTPDVIALKKNIILKQVSNRSEQSLKHLQEYFAAKEDEHKKFQLSTFFALKKMHVDAKNLQVVIEGMLTSTFGKRGFEQNNVKYLMGFDYIGGHLKLKQFTQLGLELESRGKEKVYEEKSLNINMEDIQKPDELQSKLEEEGR